MTMVKKVLLNATKRDIDKLQKLFFEYQDPTGYRFAKEGLGSFEELERLLQYTWFKTAYESWQKELRVMIKSEALTRIQEISQENSAQSLNASKYLANGEYLDEPGTKRGRPTKEEVSGELKRQVKLIDEVTQDYNRMTGLTVVQGGKK